MSKKPTPTKILKSLKSMIRNEGSVNVSFDCGSDQTGIGFGEWACAHSSPERCLIRERIITLLSLPNASESSVQGNGEISIGSSGSIELVYSLYDVHFSYFPIEVEDYPVKDVEHVCAATPAEFPKVDFEVNVGMSSWGRKDDWNFSNVLKTTPALPEESKNVVAEFVRVILAPILKSAELPYTQMETGTVGVRGFQFTGYCWHSTRELHYSYSIDKIYVKRNVKNETVTLFE